MFRGFRWQFIALAVTGVVFVVSLLLRSTARPAPDAVSETQTSAVFATATSPVESTAAPADEPTSAPATAQVIAPQQTSAQVETFTEALVGTVQRLNPLLAGLNPVDVDITSLIFEGLTRLNEYGEIEPALAREWVVSSDGLEYVVTLRDDVLWQDGLPFTAADVVFTMSLLRDPDFPGPAALGAFWRTVETEQINDYLVRFRLTQPLGSFPDALRIGILPRHALVGIAISQLASHPFNLSPIGTGPYQLEALRTGSDNRITVIDLRTAPVYRQRPEGAEGYALKRVRFQLYDTFENALAALQQGDVDAFAARNRGERAPLLATGLKSYTAIDSAVGAIIFNWAKEQTSYFKDQRVRLALGMALDRKAAVERHLQNQAVYANSPLTPTSWGYAGDIPPLVTDPAQAAALLETVTLPGSESETEPLVSFSLLTPAQPALVALAQDIVAQWAQIRVVVTVDLVDAETYQQRLQAHDFDAALVEYDLAADPDIYPYWHEGQYPEGLNYGGIADRRTSEMLERARRESSGINRKLFYKQFQHYFVERVIALPLYYPLYTYVVSDAVSGVQLGFIGASPDRFATIKDWFVLSG